MSFYGQVVYEFTKMFSQFDITPSSNDETPIIPPTENIDPVELQATTQWERIQIEPSNRWIQLRGEKDNDKKKLIKIGHGTTGVAADGKTTASLTAVQESDVPVDDANNLQFTQLTNGNYLKIPTCKYDAAGHFIDNVEDQNIENPEYTYYKLPTATINIGIDSEDEPIDITPDANDKLVFNGDSHWIVLNGTGEKLNINHTLPQYDEVEQKYPDGVEIMNIESIAQKYPPKKVSILQGKTAFLEAIIDKDQQNIMKEYFESEDGKDVTDDTTIYALAPGDLIKTNIITKDQQGHILKPEAIYYRLPVPAGEAEFSAHEARIGELEKRLSEGKTDHGEEYSTYESVVNKVYESGALTALYPTTVPEGTTITNTIGSVEAYSEKVRSITGDPDDTLYQVSEAIGEMCDKIKGNQDTIKGANARISILVAKLKELGVDVGDI